MDYQGKKVNVTFIIYAVYMSQIKSNLRTKFSI